MPINGYPRNLNPQLIFTKPDRTLTPDALYVLLAVYNRTGGAAGGVNVKTGIIAAGNSQANAAALAGDWNFVKEVPAGAGVILPPFGAGLDCIVFNENGDNTLRVYPGIPVQAGAASIQIDALGVNQPYLLPAGKMQWFRARDAALVRSMQLG